ncbi:nucleotidyltransferase family protein [Candidatus Magnetominusculus dajiuhuensis]|uniref:nucleotidyltransferase family protein n=1 Tax=Candidatus Magnetominusculus dajiuhuensis TaxID=3137712 RepID=UPI003B4398C8
MKTIDDIKASIGSCREVLETRFHVKAIGVFGSFARAEQNKRSDIDILVEFGDTVGFIELMRLEGYLKDLLGVKIDLVSKGGLKPYIGKHILEEVIYI